MFNWCDCYVSARAAVLKCKDPNAWQPITIETNEVTSVNGAIV